MSKILSLKNAKQAIKAIFTFGEHYAYAQDQDEFGITFTDYEVAELFEMFEKWKPTQSSDICELWENYKIAFTLLFEYQLVDEYGVYVGNPDYKYRKSLENYMITLY